MPNGSAVSEVIRFGRYTLDPERALLSAEGRSIALRPKAFDVLHRLLIRAGRVVSKDELAELVWLGVAVSGESLAKCVSEVRLALGADGPTIIKTIPRRGYLLDMPVSEAIADPAQAI